MPSLVRFGPFAVASTLVAVAGSTAHIPTHAAELAGVAFHPQSQSPTFRADVNLVEVDAVVTDGRGVFARDLTRDDFDLSENGKKQNITAAVLVDLPIESTASVAAQRALPASDVQTNHDVSASRVYAIVLDAFHIAPVHTGTARLLTKRFIDQNMMPGDLACVVTLGNSATSQEFTSDKQLLDAAVDRVIGEKAGSMVLDTFSRGFDFELPQRLTQVQESARGVIDVAHALADFSGRRKALVFVSEGFDFDTDAPASATSRGRPDPNASGYSSAPLSTRSCRRETSWSSRGTWSPRRSAPTCRPTRWTRAEPARPRS
jgi:VWFA-related protein